jgi:hypothetical protein
MGPSMEKQEAGISIVYLAMGLSGQSSNLLNQKLNQTF